MRFVRGCIVFLAIGPGLFMTFDGSRALILGDYLTPHSGPFAGQLGPWSAVVTAVGIAPRSITMKVIFVVLGIGWLAAATAFQQRQRWSARILATLAVLTLWYVPFGTVMSVLVLVGLAFLGWRSRTPLQPMSGAKAQVE
jgi:hypothetical protein